MLSPPRLCCNFDHNRFAGAAQLARLLVVNFLIVRGDQGGAELDQSNVLLQFRDRFTYNLRLLEALLTHNNYFAI
jgi:hypothetical protein